MRSPVSPQAPNHALHPTGAHEVAARRCVLPGPRRVSFYVRRRGRRPRGLLMAGEWFVVVADKKRGPLTFSQLQELAERGAITRESQVSRGPEGPWVAASRVKGLFAAPAADPEPVTPPPSDSGDDRMSLPVVRREQLPTDLQGKPQADETVHYFSYIDSEGGCAQPAQSKQWLLITDKRILFEASVKEGDGLQAKFVHQNGSIPMAKVSYVGSSAVKEQQGCNTVNVTNLRINSSGGQIVLAIPTLAEVQRAQEVIDGVLSRSR